METKSETKAKKSTKKASTPAVDPQIELLSIHKEIEAAKKQLAELQETAKIINKNIKDIDSLFVKDLTDRYGFNGEFMYYVGSVSSRIYQKPVNTEIVELIKRIEVLNWRDIQRINRHFMA